MNLNPKRKPQVPVEVKLDKIKRYNAIIAAGYPEKTASKRVKSTARTIREWTKQLSLA